MDRVDEIEDEVRPVESRAGRIFLIALGTFFVGLGIVGAFLPLMPTTIFIILAAACYARASRRFYRWLMEHRIFGPSLRAWRRHRSMPRRAKVIALTMVVVTFAISISVVPPLWVKGLLVVIGVTLFTFLARIPTLPPELEEP